MSQLGYCGKSAMDRCAENIPGIVSPYKQTSGLVCLPCSDRSPLSHRRFVGVLFILWTTRRFNRGEWVAMATLPCLFRSPRNDAPRPRPPSPPFTLYYETKRSHVDRIEQRGTELRRSIRNRLD